MPVVDLSSFRLLVVGASSGIGRAVGVRAAGAGAGVAFAARRTGHIEAAVAEAGGKCVALTCDVRDDDQCADTVARAAAHLGGLDAVVYATGTSPLTRLEDADGDLWRNLAQTNVVGAALVTRAALPHLESSGGRLVFLGSSSVGRPYPGLVPYATTKAALHELARGLRNEFPWLRVTTFVVGPTLSEFADGWDPDLAGAMFTRWLAEGYTADRAMEIDVMADQVLAVLASGVRVDEILVTPDPPAGTGPAA
jgi:NAD(P)-dependent dehydrogenase (short-subunit alcohol dehydrogenase family)